MGPSQTQFCLSSLGRKLFIYSLCALALLISGGFIPPSLPGGTEVVLIPQALLLKLFQFSESLVIFVTCNLSTFYILRYRSYIIR